MVTGFRFGPIRASRSIPSRAVTSFALVPGIASLSARCNWPSIPSQRASGRNGNSMSGVQPSPST